MKKMHLFGAVCVLLGLIVWGSVPAGAQEHRFQTRAKVWDVFWNTGEQGVRDLTDISYFRAMGLMYPGTFTAQWTTEFVEYWGVRQWPWGGAGQTTVWVFEGGSCMPGLNTFVSTVVDGSYYVTESKPTHVSSDVTAIAYDPSKGPEAKLGYPNNAPLGPAMANWWPGRPPPGKQHVVEIHNYRYFKYMDPDKDTFPESMLITNYATKRGITVTKKAYTWSYPDYDDFEIMEYEFENTGDSDGDGKPDLNGGQGLQLNDTYFSFSVRFMVSQSGQAFRNFNAWYRSTAPNDLDDWYKYTEAPNYDGPASAKGLKLWYAFDGDNPLLPGDDLGQPYVAAQDIRRALAPGLKKEGELMAYQYVGLAPIAYTPSSANDPGKFSFDVKGDSRYAAPRVANQPYSVKWYEYRNRGNYDEPDSKTNTYERMYNLLAGPAPSIQAQPTQPTGGFGVQTYGPYNLKLGDKVRIVLALVGAAPVEENMFGWALQGRQSDLRTNNAFNNLIKHLKKAGEAFAWGYDLPDPPPDVKVTVTVNADANNLLIWDDDADDAADPDYSGSEARDVAGYRVYRSDFKIDNWKLIGEFPVKDSRYYKGDKYEFPDRNSAAGFDYTYAVRAYDKGHSDRNGTGIAIPSLESGNSSPEQWATGVFSASPYVPPTPEANQLQRKVTVVPNPYKADGSHSYGGSSIRFTNIPHKCKISIFSVAGDLLAAINHDNPTKGEATWDQTTIDVTETVSPGVYYFVVESQVPESLGQKQRGAFMIVK